MADLTLEQARDALAREKLQLRWAEEDYEDQQRYKKVRREKELRLLELRERVAAPIDLTGDDENDRVTFKTESTEREPQDQAGRSAIAMGTPEILHAGNQVARTDAPSGARKDHLRARPERKACTLQAAADFTAPYPEHLPTIIDDPSGIPGIDYIELRCMACGANWSRNHSFFRGAKGLYQHISVSHKTELPNAEVPSIGQTVQLCSYRRLSRSEVSALRCGKKNIPQIPAAGAEADHPCRQKRGHKTRPITKKATSSHKRNSKHSGRSKPNTSSTPMENPEARQRKASRRRRSRVISESSSEEEGTSDDAGHEEPANARGQLSCCRTSPPPTAPQSSQEYSTRASRLRNYQQGLEDTTRSSHTAVDAAEEGTPVQGATTEPKAFPEKTQSVRSESIFPILGSGSASPAMVAAPSTSNGDQVSFLGASSTMP